MRLLRLVLFCDFSLHIPRFGVFYLCRTVGVRSGWRLVKSGWRIGGGRRCAVSFHGFLFFLFTDTPFCRFISLLYSEYCSSWTHLDGSWACILTSVRPACQWQFEIWHARDLRSSGKSERDGNDTWGPGNTRTVACVSSHQNRQKQVADR